MNSEVQHWGAHVFGSDVVSVLPRMSIKTELPETRIFIDKIYQEFTASGRRLQTERLVQSKGRLTWLPASPVTDDA